jgi:hypothetical protein
MVESLRRTALHEAGHAVAAITFAIPIISITIDAAIPHLRRGRYQPQHDAGLETLVVMCLAGPEADGWPSAQSNQARIASTSKWRNAI